MLLGSRFYPSVLPLLGPTQPPPRDRPLKVGQNIPTHAAFGAVAGLAAGRIKRPTGPARVNRYAGA